MTSASMTCCLDPIPTHIFKECLNVLLPVITKNQPLFQVIKSPSLFQGCSCNSTSEKDSSSSWNIQEPITCVKPVIILRTLDIVAGKCILIHKDCNKLHKKMQSAYKRYYSTETAFICIQNDITHATDDKYMYSVFVVQLDMSTALDRVDHKVLFKWLSNWFWITNQARDWVASYLVSQRQFVFIQDTRFDEHELDCNVPQDSVLGPCLFGDYSSPVRNIFRDHEVMFHRYADDMQVYAYCSIKSL